MEKSLNKNTLKYKHKGTIGIIGSAIHVAELNKMIIKYANFIGLDDDQYIPEILAVGINTEDADYIKDMARLCSDYGCDEIAIADVTTGAEDFVKTLSRELSTPIFGCNYGETKTQLAKLAKTMVDNAINKKTSLISRPKLTYTKSDTPAEHASNDEDIERNLCEDTYLRFARIKHRMKHGGYPILYPSTGYGGRFVGIIGGSGPLASAELSFKFAKRGIPFIHCSVNSAPGRLLYEQGLGPSYVKHYKNAVDFLTRIGAEVLAIPCNTAHKRLSEFCDERSIGKVVDICKTTLDETRERRSILLGTPTTGVNSGSSSIGIYEKYRREYYSNSGDFILPNPQQQDTITEAIFDVKAGELELAKKKILKVIKEIRSRDRDKDFAESDLDRTSKIPVILASAELVLPFTKLERITYNSANPLQLIANRVHTNFTKPSPSISPSITTSEALIPLTRSKL
jgi:aspartate racemase